MATIHQWRVLRSGRHMEVKGLDASGHPVTIRTAVIHAANADNPHPTAQDERGQYYDLI